jgi:hypothetical protein
MYYFVDTKVVKFLYLKENTTKNNFELNKVLDSPN